MRFLAALLFVLCLPLTAFAGVMDDAAGSWTLDAEKTKKAENGGGDVPFDTMTFDKGKNTIVLKSTQSKEEMPIVFTVKSTTATSADLEMKDENSKNTPVLRLELKGKNELSLGEMKNKKRKDILYFKR